MPDTDRPDSNVTRFIFDSTHFAASLGRVKPRALEPSRMTGATSVFIINGLEENQIWKLATTYVAPLRGKDVLARADLTRAHIASVGLVLVVDDTPPRHANVRGWPTDKDKMKLKAQELAALATLRLP